MISCLCVSHLLFAQGRCCGFDVLRVLTGSATCPTAHSTERGTPGGAKAELRDIIAASDLARCKGSVEVIRQGNEADLFCNDAGGPLDIFSVAVGTNDLASAALRVGP